MKIDGLLMDDCCFWMERKEEEWREAKTLYPLARRQRVAQSLPLLACFGSDSSSFGQRQQLGSDARFLLAATAACFGSDGS